MGEPLVETSLRQLQVELVNSKRDEAGRPARILQLPGSDPESLLLSRADVTAMAALGVALGTDLRFEHIRSVDKVVDEYVIDCWVDRTTGAARRRFIDANAREPESSTCFLAVEYLSVPSEVELFGVRLLPLDDQRIPAFHGVFAPKPPLASIAAVDVRGTDAQRMAERARPVAEHALRVLRIALRKARGVPERQLRFKVGTAYAFQGGAGGNALPEDAAILLGLDAQLLELARVQPVTRTPAAPKTDVDKAVDRAMRWIERSQMTGDPLVALLYLFFALEAILGDTSEGSKASGLAMRQAILSHVRTGGFSHPDRTWLLYDEVRSAAVHGSPVKPVVDWKVTNSFGSGVLQALDDYLELAHQRDFQRRGPLLSFLDGHADRGLIERWLREHGGRHWIDYLDGRES